MGGAGGGAGERAAGEVDREAKVAITAGVGVEAEGGPRVEREAKVAQEAEVEVIARKRAGQKVGRESLDQGAAAAKGIIIKKTKRGKVPVRGMVVNHQLED